MIKLKRLFFNTLFMMGLGFGGYMMGGGWALYHLFCFITLLGIAFLLIWIARFGTKAEILKWTKLLIAVGIIGGIIAMAISFAGFRFLGGKYGNNLPYPMMFRYQSQIYEGLDN